MTTTRAETASQPGQGEADARARIGAAAESLFAERGYAGTSMQAIADAAGVNKAMLYYYFKDKRDLYHAVIGEGLATMGRVLDEIAAQPGPARQKVADFARRSYTAMAERPGVVRMIYRELMGLAEKGEIPLHDHVCAQLDKLEAIIRQGVEQGEFRPVDAHLAVRSLLGMLQIFIKESLMTGETYPPDDVVNHTVDLFHRGIAK